jgi:hypothetical protein
MKPQAAAPYGVFDDPLTGVEDAVERSEDDLWFLTGPIEDEPDDLPPGPRAEPRETAILDDWRKAEADNAARLARVAGRLSGLDERLRRGPEGLRHRLALIEAADLSWFVGDRIGPEVDLAAFVDRRDPENLAGEAEPFADRAGGWLDLMAQAADLHHRRIPRRP